MTSRKLNHGFTLVELVIVIGLVVILMAIAFPSFRVYYKNYKFNDYAYSMEHLIKGSKLTAMERSINVGLCVNSGTQTLTIINMGESRSNTCTGATLNTFQIDDSFVSLSGSGSAFDPRGFAIFNGNVCVSKNTNERHYKVVISRFGAIRIEKGAGGC